MLRTIVLCSRVTCISLLLLIGPLVSAQCVPLGGTSQLDANTFDINVGTSIPATGTLQTCSWPLSLPAPGKIVKLQGTMVFRGNCGGDTNAVVTVDGNKSTYYLKQKLGSGGGVSTVFVSYDIPLAYSTASASIDFAGFIPSNCPGPGIPDWEFKGVMQVAKPD